MGFRKAKYNSYHIVKVKAHKRYNKKIVFFLTIREDSDLFYSKWFDVSDDKLFHPNIKNIPVLKNYFQETNNTKTYGTFCAKEIKNYNIRRDTIGFRIRLYELLMETDSPYCLKARVEQAYPSLQYEPANTCNSLIQNGKKLLKYCEKYNIKLNESDKNMTIKKWGAKYLGTYTENGTLKKLTCTKAFGKIKLDEKFVPQQVLVEYDISK